SRSRTVETHDLSEDAPAQRGSAPVPLMTALRVPGVVLILLAFFAYCSLESTALVWSATYMVSERGAPPAAAAMLGALFVLGLTAGRFLAGFLADRLGDRAMIRGGFLAIGLGSVLLLLPLPTDVVGFVGLVIVGLGSAPVYPAIIHSTPGNFGRRNSQAIIGIQMASAYVGSTLAPPLFGVLSAWTGMWVFPVFLAVLMALGLAMSQRLNRVVPATVPALLAAPLPRRHRPGEVLVHEERAEGRAAGGDRRVREAGDLRGRHGGEVDGPERPGMARGVDDVAHEHEALVHDPID